MNNVVRDPTNLLLRLFVFSSGALDDFDGNNQSSWIGSSVDNAVAPWMMVLAKGIVKYHQTPIMQYLVTANRFE
jgi:hypothetical protein